MHISKAIHKLESLCESHVCFADWFKGDLHFLTLPFMWGSDHQWNVVRARIEGLLEDMPKFIEEINGYLGDPEEWTIFRLPAPLQREYARLGMEFSYLLDCVHRRSWRTLTN